MGLDCSQKQSTIWLTNHQLDISYVRKTVKSLEQLLEIQVIIKTAFDYVASKKKKKKEGKQQVCGLFGEFANTTEH